MLKSFPCFLRFVFLLCIISKNSFASVINYDVYEDFEKYHHDLIEKYMIKNNGSKKMLFFIEAFYGYNTILLDDFFKKEIILNFDLFSHLFIDYVHNINNDVFISHDFKRLLLIGIYYHKKKVHSIGEIIKKRKLYKPDEANVDSAFELIIKQHLSLDGSLFFLKQILEERMNITVDTLKNIFDKELFDVQGNGEYVKKLLDDLRAEMEKLKAFFVGNNGVNDLIGCINDNNSLLKGAYEVLLVKSTDFKDNFRSGKVNKDYSAVNVRDFVIINIICLLIKIVESLHSVDKFIDKAGNNLVPEHIIFSKKFINYFDDNNQCDEESGGICDKEMLIQKYYNCISMIIDNPFFINLLFGAAYFVDYFTAINLMQKDRDNLVKFYDYNKYRSEDNNYTGNYENFCHPSLLSSHARVLNSLILPEAIKHLFIVGPSGSGKTLFIRSIQIVQELIKKYGLLIGSMKNVKLYDVIIDYNNICSVIRALDAKDSLDNDVPLKNSDGRIQYTAMLIICDLVKINKDKNFLIIMNEPFVNVPLEQLSEKNPHSLLFNLELLFRLPNATILCDSHLGCLKYFSFIRSSTCNIALGYMPIEKDSVAIWSSYPTFKLTLTLPEHYIDNVISTTQILQKIEELPDESFMRYAMLASFGEAMRLKSRILDELGYQKGFLVL